MLTITCLDVLTVSTSVGGARFIAGQTPVVSLSVADTVATVRAMRGCGMGYRVDLDGRRVTAEDLGWMDEVAERHGDVIAMETVRLHRRHHKAAQPGDGAIEIVTRIAGEPGRQFADGVLAAHRYPAYLPGPYTIAALAIATQG